MKGDIMKAMPLATDCAFTAEEQAAVYKCIFNRRDIRGQFLSDPVPDEVLARILKAAHHAPSVGFMQPWDFIIVRDHAVKGRIHAAFRTAQMEATAMFDETKRESYKSLKLQGILDAPLGICVTCDRARNGPVVIGRTHLREMDLYSAVCAVRICAQPSISRKISSSSPIFASAMSTISQRSPSWRAPAGCRAWPCATLSGSIAGASEAARKAC